MALNPSICGCQGLKIQGLKLIGCRVDTKNSDLKYLLTSVMIVMLVTQYVLC